MKHILYIGILAALGVFAARGQGNDRLTLVTGKTEHGELSDIVGGYITLIQQSGRGVVERRYNPIEIREIHFSDTKTQAEASDFYANQSYFAAIDSLESLVRRRLPFLEYLAPADQGYFAKLIHCYSISGQEQECLRKSRLWRSKLRQSANADLLDEYAMDAAWRIGRTEDAKLIAHQWIESGKSSKSTTIAWNILAEDALLDGNYEYAFWTALNPIPFTRIHLPRHIEKSYAIAIVASRRVAYEEYTNSLIEEMKSLSLDWPTDIDRFSDSTSPAKAQTLKPKAIEHLVGQPSGNRSL